jgi:sorbitol-specific phosphotransferase system component IIC
MQSNPILNKIGPDVEALLVNRVGLARGVSAAEYYIVPIDACYKLVGLIRIHWRGLSGGTEVWKEIADFFTQLRTRAEVEDRIHA